MKLKKFRCSAFGQKVPACCRCSGVLLGFVKEGRTIIQRYEDRRFIKGMCIDIMGAEKPGVYPGVLDEIPAQGRLVTDGDSQCEPTRPDPRSKMP